MAKNSFEQYLIGKGLSSSTTKWYNRYVLDFISWLDKENADPDEATAGDITAYLHKLKQQGQANITRRNQLIAVRHYLDWRVGIGAREDNPAKHIKIRGVKRQVLYPVMNVQELERIYQSYTVPKPDDPRSGRNWFYGYRLGRQRNKVILGLMVWQGLTTAEVNRLTVSDLHLHEGTIDIAGSRDSNERTLELKPQQIMGLMEYIMQTRKELLQHGKREDDNLLFIPSPAYGKKQATTHNAINVWKRLSQDVRQQHPRFINFLQVRSSVIVHWLKHHNLREVQYMAGHRYVSSTEAYKVGNIEELQEDIGKYHPIS